jgi:formate dehydrogenase major subunit
MGITALGLVNRGFNSEVKPEFALPLKESACISCGQCADVCPTGACMEKQAVPKQVPVELASTPSVCSCCSVGCRLTLETRGNMVYRSVPERETGEGLLCARGRFGINHINDQSRLLSPLVRVDGSLRKAS